MTTDIEVIDHDEIVAHQPAPVTLFRTDDPVEVVARATATANALMEAVKAHDKGKPPAKRLISVISGREFPKVECWTLLGTMLGVFPVLDGEPERVEIDGVTGWKAIVVAKTRDGSEVGRAMALCMRSENNWRGRDEYALASMAQTRATSKALSVPLRFVMTLAGLEGTPAEEMPPEAVPKADVPDALQAAESERERRELQEAVQAGIDRLGPVDEHWTLPAVLTAATKAFGKKITAISDLNEAQLSRLLEGISNAEEQLAIEEVPA